jgi:hypothetical protein
MRRPDARGTEVGTLAAVLRQADVTPEDFIEALKR